MPGKRKYGMDHDHYVWSPLTSRPPLRWPNEARVALCVVVTLEHLEWESPQGWFQTSGMYPRPMPDYTTFSHRDYGRRVGLFRILDLLQRLKIPATIAIDSATASNFPLLVQHCKERDCEFVAHGAAVSRMITNRMPEAEERAYIQDCLKTLNGSLGVTPRGWFGPQYGESERTPRLLAEAGVEYVCDWVNDEQPYRMTVPKGDLCALPVMLDLDDDFAFRQRRVQVDVQERALRDAFDVLYADGAVHGRVLVLSLSAWLSGQPYRIRFLGEALKHVMNHSGVWAARGGDIIDWYRQAGK